MLLTALRGECGMGDEWTRRMRGLHIDAERRSPAAGVRSGRLALGLLATLLALLAAVGGWTALHSWRGSGAGPAAVGPATAAKPAAGADAAAPVLIATGEIVSDHVVTVTAQVPGPIVGVPVEQGRRVERGQLLAQIDEIDYRLRRDMQAAALRETEAVLEKARYDRDRTAALHAQQQISDAEWVAASTALARAEAQLAAARAALALAEQQLSDCRITAPIAGTVLERHVEVGEFVTPEGGEYRGVKTQVATIADTEHLRVEVDVFEEDISRIRANMQCAIVPDAYRQRRYAGRVLWVDPRGDYSKGAVGVKVRIENPDEFTRIGGGARVEFLE